VSFSHFILKIFTSQLNLNFLLVVEILLGEPKVSLNGPLLQFRKFDLKGPRCLLINIKAFKTLG